MKHIIILSQLLLFISSITAQNNNLEAFFEEYSKHSISFENPKIKEYSEKYANFYNDFCVERLTNEEFINKLTVLSRIYAVYFVNITDKDKTNLIETQKLIHADGEKYIRKRELRKSKAYVIAEMKKKNKELYSKIESTDVSFKNKHFKKFAYEM